MTKINEKNFSTKNSKSESDVIDFYDKYAKTWDSRFGNSFSTNHFLYRRWRSFEDAIKLSSPHRGLAVELGVGTGVYISKVSSYFDKIVAVDGSQKMLDELDKKIHDYGIKNISLIQSNALDVRDISEDSVDCVYFFGLIEHIVDVKKFIEEIRRMLKNNGIVIGVTPNGSSPWYSLRKILRGTGKHCSTDKYYTANDLDSYFEVAGFKRIYTDQWGAVPAGLSDLIAKPLSKAEVFLERSPIKKYLGGLTFGYKLIK